jgi:hypothetical protein
MRKLLMSVFALLALGAVAVSPSLADNPSQTVLSGSAKVTPSKPGTKRHPRGVKLQVKVRWDTPDQFDKPVVQSSDVLFPKGSLYNGQKYPSCSQNTLSRKGLSGCPKKSIMGSGTGTAFADTVLTTPKITVVNGGKSKVFLYTQLTNPARVNAPVPGTITKQSGQWAYKLHLEVPQSLQVVAGVPIALRDLMITAGGKTYAKDWLATTGCAGGSWPFSVKTFFDNGGDAIFEDAVDCS